MNYFEKTGYSEKQNKKDLTWEEAKNLPIYVMTKAGHIWQRNHEVPRNAINHLCYIALQSAKPIELYFFEKAELNGRSGVKLHLVQKWFPKVKGSYDLAINLQGIKDRWVFITPDWKTYNMKGDPIKVNARRAYEPYAPGYCDFRNMKVYAHDLRNTGLFMEGQEFCEASAQLLSPATVAILKEAGFDVKTQMFSTWQIQSHYRNCKIPDGSYKTEWFVENLVHPNRVAMRKRENSSIKHDYNYFLNLMGSENFLVFEENGQVYVAQKDITSLYDGVTVSYLKVRGSKSPACVFYSSKGNKKLRGNAMRSVFDHSYRWGDEGASIKAACSNAISQLLGKECLLDKTEVFKNLIPTLRKAKNDLAGADVDLASKIYFDLSYILSPVGQKDRVFEETVKQDGLGKGIRAESFLRTIEGWGAADPDLRQKTPYGQVGLTKSAYYELMKFAKSGFSIYLRSMVYGLVVGDVEWRSNVSKEGYVSKKMELCPYLTSDFLELIKRTVFKSTERYNGCYAVEGWLLLLRLAGKSTSSPLSEKMAAVTRLLRKSESDPALLEVVCGDFLEDYYRQVDELAPLGIDWPQRYEEFHVKNVMWFLGTLQRRYRDLVDQAESVIPNASFERRIEILHAIQNQLSALNRLEVEKAALQEMDKQYAPWKEQLRKALGWKGQNLGIFIPESLAELTMEGKILHHCVGSYKRDVALRKEGILFLRKLSCPDMPYYTLDVVKEPSGKYTVRQCHGDCNSNPTPEVIEALKKWAADTGKVDENSIKDDYRALCCL